MREHITLCKRSQDGSLTVIGEATVKTYLDEAQMKVFARYQRKAYELLGNALFSYIVLE